MKSRTSYISPTLYIKNIKRFWPIWSVYCVLLLMIYPLSLISNLDKTTNVHTEHFNSLREILSTEVAVPFLFVFCIITAIFIFSYLFFPKTCNMIHSYPFKRHTLFHTNYAYGLTFLILPQIIIFLICVFIGMHFEIPHAEYLLFWLIQNIVITFVFFSFAVLSCVLSGHIIAAASYYLLINLIVYCIKGLFVFFFETFYCGMNSYSYYGQTSTPILDYFSPFVKLFHFYHTVWDRRKNPSLTSVFPSVSVFLVYFAVSLGITVFSYYLYKKRQLESAGEMSALPFMYPIVRWIVSFLLSFMAAAFIWSILFFNNRNVFMFVVLFLIFTAVFFLIVEMILKKKFRIITKKYLIEYGCYICISFLVIFALGKDIFHVESYIPNVAKVRSATIVNNTSVMNYTKTKRIQQVTELHRAALKEKNHPSDHDDTSKSYQIYYQMENGQMISRSYNLPKNLTLDGSNGSTPALLDQFENNPTQYLSFLFTSDYKHLKFQSSRKKSQLESITDERRSIELSSKDTEKLYQAYRKDVLEGSANFRTCKNQDTSDYIIRFCGYVNGYDKSIQTRLPKMLKKELSNESFQDHNYTLIFSNENMDGRPITQVDSRVQISSEYKHTIRFLLSHKYIKNKHAFSFS